MMTNQQRQAKYYAAHRDEINVRQRAAYYATPVECRPRRARLVTGVLAVAETPDTIESTAPNLRERYLLALLKRDAAIWKKHHRRENSSIGVDGDDAESAATAGATGNTFEGHQCRKCGGFLRYKSSHKCVACRRRQRQQWQHTAREQRIEQPNSIRAFAIELLKLTHHKDHDGREIGLTYDQIRDAVLRRFPTVKTPGRHYGRQTVLAYKELHEIASNLKRNGETIPFRPRRSRSDAGKRRAKATARPASASGRRVASDTGRASPANSRHRRHGHNPTEHPTSYMRKTEKQEAWSRSQFR
jgi:hypothetical protein